MRTAYIGMGSNLVSQAGPPAETLAAAAERLESLGCVNGRSSLYSTAPVGFAEQARFVNAVVELKTEFEPHDLLDALLEIERAFGRDRAASFPNGPRTLDLDILLMDNLVVSAPDLEIPHPRLAERAFVLVPLNEIAPQCVDPRSGMTIAQLLCGLPADSSAGADAVAALQSRGWHAGRCEEIARTRAARPLPGTREPTPSRPCKAGRIVE